MINIIIINELKIYINNIIFKYYIYTVKLLYIFIFYNKYWKATCNIIQFKIKKIKNINKDFLNQMALCILI